MVIIMPIGYGFTDLTGGSYVTDVPTLNKIHQEQVAAIKKENPGQDIIDLSGIDINTVTTQEAEESTPLTYTAMNSKGMQTKTGLPSFEHYLSELMAHQHEAAMISISHTGGLSIDSLIAKIESIENNDTARED